MKKGIVFICVLLIMCMTLSAFAQNVQTQPSELLASVLAGNTFVASLSDCMFNIEDPQSAIMTFTIYERDEFAVEDIESLQVGDTVTYGSYMSDEVFSVLADEYGITINEDTPNTTVSFYKDEAGRYIAIDEEEHAYWHEVFTFTIQADASVIYRDWSDPEAEAPIDRTFAELLEDIANDVLFFEDNTKITFDDAGRLTVVQRNYSPWN